MDADYLLGVIPWVPTVNTVDEYVGWTSQEFQSRFEEQFDVNPTTVGASAFAGGIIRQLCVYVCMYVCLSVCVFSYMDGF